MSIPVTNDADMAELALIERRKMMAGEAYNAMFDQDLIKGRLDARQLTYKYNSHPGQPYYPNIPPSEQFGPDDRYAILQELFGLATLDDAKKLAIEPPLRCDFGKNVKFEGDFYANFGLTLLDCAQITFGHRVLCAPNVQVYAATHSVDVAERIAGLERAYPVTVGDDVWIGGNVCLIGPCKIGKNCTIAAGAVVRGDFPDNVVIGGIPARVLKTLPPPEEEKAEAK